MAAVMIGVDPHKGSHTAVAIGAAEEPLGELRVRSSASQAGRLVEWAAAWPERTWAVEGAGGLGHLLAQQLVAAGERVLDVQPKLAARVRLLAAGDVNKTSPDDARPVAVAALRSKGRQEVLAGIGHLDAQRREVNKKLAAAVTASGTKPHRGVRRRAGHRRHRHRRRHHRGPVPQPGPFRRLQRHRPGRGVL
jgi:hypothetical protein